MARNCLIAAMIFIWRVLADRIEVRKEMKNSIFTTPRRDLMGDKALGAEYMPAVAERARRIKAAVREEKQSAVDPRQQFLPGFEKCILK